MRYEQIIQSVRETPWAIHPIKLAEILTWLQSKAAGSDGGPAAAKPAKRETDRSYRLTGSTAIIPISGTILPRGSGIADASGLTTIPGLKKQFREAAQDKGAKTIVMDIDSPGGAVYGLPELGDEIRGITYEKPVIAQVNPVAFSAAYWLAAQADAIHMLPSGETGSIGVWAAHADFSEFERKQGIKTTLVKAGKYKIEANPWEPLGKEARAQIQKAVDEYYDMFLDAVAVGRGIPRKTVEKKFGEGRVFRAAEAAERGMVDKLATLEETVIGSNVAAELAGQAAAIDTVREFERFLRRAGFARDKAAGIASHGFDSKTAGQRDAGGLSAQRDAERLILARAREILTI